MTITQMLHNYFDKNALKLKQEFVYYNQSDKLNLIKFYFLSNLYIKTYFYNFF